MSTSYLDRQAVDTTTPAGKALFQMLGVFAEFRRQAQAAEQRHPGWPVDNQTLDAARGGSGLMADKTRIEHT